jgi:hypothetical protein
MKKQIDKVDFLLGNVACAEGAIYAGCRFFAAYPITPASEIGEHFVKNTPKINGFFIQTEDELAAIGSVIGASWGGMKAMTATSGPGISLMSENIGLAVSTETPCVIVNVQRGAPSTGSPSLPLQADMLQAKFGSQGDYEIIAYAPSSPQEMFDHTVLAFNSAEKYRTPVFVLSDALVGHMYEQVRFPAAGAVPLVERKIQGSYKKGESVFLDENIAPGLPHRLTAADFVSGIGDIVLARRGMGTSYHLSVVVDDATQGITLVTRGKDLLDSTWIHVVLQRLLNLPEPRWHHHRLIRDDHGKRLAKRDDARALRLHREQGVSPADIRQMLGV